MTPREVLPPWLPCENRVFAGCRLFRQDLSFGAVCREIGWWGELFTTKLPPLPSGSRSIVNCHCLHRFHSVFGGVYCSPLALTLGSWSCVSLCLLLLLLGLLSPPLFPSFLLLLFLRLRWLRHHLHPLSAANMLHTSLSAVHVPCTVLRVGGLQTLLLPLFPPCSLLLQMAKWAHHHHHYHHLLLPFFNLLPPSPLPSLLLHLLRAHAHVHVHVHLLNSIMLGLSL